MSRSGYHAALVKPAPSRLTQFAETLNGLIAMRQQNLINATEFVSLLTDLGVHPETVALLGRVVTSAKGDELLHEYETCPDCNCVDGTHTGDCLSVN